MTGIFCLKKTVVIKLFPRRGGGARGAAVAVDGQTEVAGE